MGIPTHRQVKAKASQGVKLKAPKFEPNLRNQKIITDTAPSFSRRDILARTDNQGSVDNYSRMNSVFIADIDIVQGEYKKVNHNLGRVPVGWSLTDTQIATVSLLTVVRPVVHDPLDSNLDGINIYDWTDKYIYLSIVGLSGDPGKVISAASWSGGVVSATTSTAHGYFPGNIVTVVLGSPAAYDGTFTIISTPTTTSFTYATPNNPGVFISGGVILTVVTRVGIEIW